MSLLTYNIIIDSIYRVHDNTALKLGHKTHLWCSQDSARKKKSKASTDTTVKNCDHVGMQHFDCKSHLTITCRKDGSLGRKVISVRLKHHDRHKPYFDVEMPPGATQIVRENIEWSTPVSMVPQVQAEYPNVTSKQVHKAWTAMSEVMWQRDPYPLPSARILLMEFPEDADVFTPNTPEGVTQLCWGMRKISEQLRGKVVEIGIDATCT